MDQMCVVGGDKLTRRARQKPMQSCEIVGILPAEELALRRALYASLMQHDSPKKKSSDTEMIPTHKIKLERDLDMVPEPAKRIKLERDGGNVSDIDVICLSSPDLSDDDYSPQESKNVDTGSLPVSSCPSSPQSYSSTNSLHLCLSSSSSWYSASESSSSSCDSLFSPWNPSTKKKRKQARKSKGKSAQQKKTLNFDGKSEVGRVGVKLKGSIDQDNKSDAAKGKPRQTARKSAARVKPEEFKDGDLKDVPFQAQRKFVANHVPQPIRVSLGKVKHVGLKAPPKTEDFITYLCLRGSPNIPKHLRRFQTPWTPLKKEQKATKSKKRTQQNY